jgi:hypothetical protein
MQDRARTAAPRLPASSVDASEALTARIWFFPTRIDRL